MEARRSRSWMSPRWYWSPGRHLFKSWYRPLRGGQICLRFVRALIGVNPFEPKRLDDVNYAAKPVDRYVAYATLTPPRTVALSLEAQYLFGRTFWIADLSGACLSDRRIFARAAGDDTIAGQPSVFMASGFQKLVFHSNGSNLWTVA